MKKIELKRISIENFKGCKELEIGFGKSTCISGRNASGKSTIIDAYFWLLFNKNASGAEKFQIRPLNEEGGMINNVEIKVVANILVDGKEYELSKIQKQNWVKKRGGDTETLQGNVNSFSINGYPKTGADYAEFVNEIIDEEVFKILVNPFYFAGLDWKEQRKIITKIASDVPDAILATRDIDKFGDLISELEIASTEDIKNKYTKAMNEWKSQQKLIPIRIDEVEKSKVDIDVAEYELQKAGLEKEIEELERLLEAPEGSNTEFSAKSEQWSESVNKIAKIERDASLELKNKRDSLEYKVMSSGKSIVGLSSTIESIKRDIENCKQKIEFNDNSRTLLGEEYKKVHAESFDKESAVCPTCLQKLPEDKLSALEIEYEERKKNRLDIIIRDGNELKRKIEELKSQISGSEKSIDAYSEEMELEKKEMEKNKSLLAELPREIDLSGNEEYQKSIVDVNKLADELKSIEKPASRKAEYGDKLRGLRKELSSIESIINSADNSAKDERIQELEEEKLVVAQKIADQERMIFMLEEFIKYKMNAISDEVNSKFNIVNFKLFDTQINGGIKECCECTVNGVPYSVLNSGHRIIAGLDIIKTLSDLYSISVPVFVDNAECLSDNNKPSTDGQLIYMEVANGDFSVEVSE